MEHGNKQPSGVGHRKFNALVRCQAMVTFASFDKSLRCCNKGKYTVNGSFVCGVHRKMLNRGDIMEFAPNS